MTTFREAVAAKTSRQRRERRHYTPDLLGRECSVCGIKLPAALTAAGELSHPMCASEELGIAR